MTTCDGGSGRKYTASPDGWPTITDEPCGQTVGLTLILGLSREWHACRYHLAEVTQRMLLDDLAEQVRHDERNAAWLDDLPEEDDWFERSSYA